MSIYSTPLKSNWNGHANFANPSSNINGLQMGGVGATSLVPQQQATDGGLGAFGANMTTVISGLNGNATNPLSFDASHEHIKVAGLGAANPLNLASQYIDHLLRRDISTPVLDERSYYNNGVNYNFSKEIGGLGPFTPFERLNVINIPDEILQQVSTAEIKTNMGLFPDIERCWISVDNKLILWNYDNPSDFQSIDDIKHTILQVALVKPKPDTFVESITHLLLITTPFDIYVLAISSDKNSGSFNIFNTGMSVSVHGLDVHEIVYYEKTGQIFFSGNNNGTNIWELQYSASEDWFNNKCSKICLTQSALLSLLPSNLFSKIPGSSYVQSLFEEDSKYAQEYITHLTVDQSRGILYSLSSKSVIRAYKINGKSLDGPTTIEPSYIKRIMGTTPARGAAILGSKYLKIVKVEVVSLQENNNLFLVAITVGGVRLYFNGSVNSGSVEALRLESIKFPPSSVSPETIEIELQQQQQQQARKLTPFYSSLNSMESVQLKYQKKSSVLLESSKASSIISPGIFFTAVAKHPAEQLNGPTENPVPTTQNVPVHHKLFVSVPDYGILKNHGRYVENSVFLDTTAPVRQILPLTSLFNATNKPEGYANAFATQYSVEPLKVAVLTNTSVEIYKYRNVDQVLESLINNPLPFIINYGLVETCSSALFVTCKFNKSEALRSNALTLFTVGIPNVVEIKPTYNRYANSAVSTLLSKPSLNLMTPQRGSTKLSKPVNAISTPNVSGANSFDLDDVVLSARFYGTTLLIARLFRDIWDKDIFQIDPNVKISPNNSVIKSSVKGDNIITKIAVSRADIEYYLSSVMILNEFFQSYGNSITTITNISPINGEKAVDKCEDVAHQAENVAMNAIIKLLQSIKESLSFLNVLFEESEVDGFEGQYLAFVDIMKYLNLDIQYDLSKLKFKDIFNSNDHTKNLIREILSSIINRSITKGGSIEYIATALQERCGSFCSTGDVLGFRAVEHLRKAKEIGLRDQETLDYHMTNAAKLFEKIVDDISLDKIKEAVGIMLELNYYPKTVEFLLNIANAMDKGKLALQYVADGSLEHDERKKYYDARVSIYETVFETLIKVDRLAALPENVNNQDIQKTREEVYNVTLKYNDKLFHHQMYDWLVQQKSEEKLLQLDTEFILPYLEEKAAKSLEISNLLWVYQSKRSHFLQAAQILYSLAISDFEIPLQTRIEYLSRANGFCNGVCPPSQRQAVIQLSSMIQEVVDVAGIQDEIVRALNNDLRVDTTVRSEALKQLEGKILTVTELYNDFAAPLSYYELCLLIFKVSDFRNHEEIISKWQDLFNSLKEKLSESSTTDEFEKSTTFINLSSSTVIRVGKNVRTSEFVFPVVDLFPLISNLIYENLPKEHIRPGSIASIFIEAGVSYDRMYHVLKDLIETTTTTNDIYEQEIVWLIKEWYQSDRKLRALIPLEEIRSFESYSTDTDPLENYKKRTGDTVF
ncbi:unnamed protein product [Kluyveromyces dobzhanskii CBS 2104]|uniref:WGS project CCBQ000000000 data, contig 00011 n=1 Tax=Kluyveromyces dobzhanskii CBS 2104 TaxID=1427455 RepID=A0A0A8L7Y7_9SACH|nr:unnamed protein product [Kluyveromyces dobzhanskii CBS 2104]